MVFFILQRPLYWCGLMGKVLNIVPNDITKVRMGIIGPFTIEVVIYLIVFWRIGWLWYKNRGINASKNLYLCTPFIISER